MLAFGLIFKPPRTSRHMLRSAFPVKMTIEWAWVNAGLKAVAGLRPNYSVISDPRISGVSGGKKAQRYKAHKALNLSLWMHAERLPGIESIKNYSSIHIPRATAHAQGLLEC